MKRKRNLLVGMFLCLATLAVADGYDTYYDTWVCTDGLGRIVASSDHGITRSSVDTITKIGMFYYLWQGQHGAEIKDITSLLAADPVNPAWGGSGQFHWGGKPALGYYAGGDNFIIAKHMQMLMDAGIDFYFFDVTNGFTYDNNVKAVMAEVDRRAALGLRIPKLAFMTHSGSVATLQRIYNTFYANSANDKYWYKWNGKPLVLSNEDEIGDMPDSLKNYFTIRYSWAWSTGKNRWPWLANYPQEVGYVYNSNSYRVVEQLSISTAQHPMSKIGKSYHSGSEPSFDEYGLCKETPQGLYFQEQWKRALSMTVRPKVLMITQWNEWMAQRFIINSTAEYSYVRPGATAKIGETYFVDVYNQEFNRDIEPSSEPLIRDNYYLQLVSNVRQFRGVRTIPVPTVSKTINLSNGFSQWDEVSPDFMDEPGDTYYTSSTAEAPASLTCKSNDIVKSKVTKDVDSLYFYVSTNSVMTAISSSTNVRWMTLLINSDCAYTTGWEGYDYMVSNDGGLMKLYSYDSTSKSWVFVNNCRMYKYGKEMMLALAKSDVNLAGDVDFDFKWIDNIPKTSTEILDFIVDGEAAPNGRFNYRYKGSKLTSIATGIKTVVAGKPQFNVNANNGVVTFTVQAAAKGALNIKVFDMAGAEIANIDDANSQGGTFSKSIHLQKGNYVARCSVGGVQNSVKFNNDKD